MLDLKVFNSALEQLEEERGIPRESILEAVEMALASAYKRDFGKKGQIVRARFNPESGKAEFEQVKIVVTEDTVRMPEEDDDADSEAAGGADNPRESAPNRREPAPQTESADNAEEEDVLPLYDPEKHIFLDDAKRIKKDAEVDEELIFPLEAQDDYGRIAAQTAKQVIIQKIREAEKTSVLGEYKEREGEIVSGIVQRVDRGNVFVDLNRVVGFLPAEEQIPNEHYRQGSRIKAYILSVEESQRGISIRLSRSHPEFLRKLFEIEAPEIINGVVVIEGVAREPGARSKIAVSTTDRRVDPIGAMVGQRGIRVSTVTNELAGEKIDIIQWSEDPEQFIADALSPARITGIEVNEEEKRATVAVGPDQYSLAIGKGGQNVRLAAKLTGYRIDIRGAEGEVVAKADGEEVEIKEEEVKEAPLEPTDPSGPASSGTSSEAEESAEVATEDEAPKTEAEKKEESAPETPDEQNITPGEAEAAEADLEEKKMEEKDATKQEKKEKEEVGGEK